ncbi:MAG: Mur ligase family protein, partial [Anaerolineae bacterium]
DFPAHRLRVIGVTGTDGKTTTTNLIYHILRAAGWNAGMISTINADIAGRVYDTGLHTTTPDAPAVQRYLREMVDAGAQAAVLEATSHGLAQYRVAACAFDTAVVTNITHEHLDYHGSYEAYFEAKARLFWDLSQSMRKPGIPKISVLNADDERPFAGLSRIPADLVVTYGRQAGADVRAEDVECTGAGIRFRAVTPFGDFDVHSPLVGEYNVHNLLAAIAAALAQGIAPAHVQAGIAGMVGLTGRMERIDRGQPFTVIIDFAHTPNALQKALTTARGMTRGRLTVVFGCAGLRDVQKRPMMGRIAAELADRVILTAEDPRTENLRDINAQIIAGFRQSGRPMDDSLMEIDDRA